MARKRYLSLPPTPYIITGIKSKLLLLLNYVTLQLSRLLLRFLHEIARKRERIAGPIGYSAWNVYRVISILHDLVNVAPLFFLSLSFSLSNVYRVYGRKLGKNRFFFFFLLFLLLKQKWNIYIRRREYENKSVIWWSIAIIKEKITRGGKIYSILLRKT